MNLINNYIRRTILFIIYFLNSIIDNDIKFLWIFTLEHRNCIFSKWLKVQQIDLLFNRVMLSCLIIYNTQRVTGLTNKIKDRKILFFIFLYFLKPFSFKYIFFKEREADGTRDERRLEKRAMLHTIVEL